MIEHLYFYALYDVPHYFGSSMAKMAPSVATLPIDTSFAHGDIISRPSSSVHVISLALAREKDLLAGGEQEYEEGNRTRWGPDRKRNRRR